MKKQVNKPKNKPIFSSHAGLVQLPAGEQVIDYEVFVRTSADASDERVEEAIRKKRRETPFDQKKTAGVERLSVSLPAPVVSNSSQQPQGGKPASNAVTAKQGSIKKKRRWTGAEEERIKQTLNEMLRRWPAIFASPPPGPLKIGIAKDLQAAFPDRNKNTISRALGRWMRWHRAWYLRALIAGAARYDLDGNECGTVTAEEQADAAKKQAEFRKKAEQLAQEKR